MKVFQVGAAGGIGRRLAALLTARGDEVTGMHRSPDQAATISAAGASPLTGDLIADSVEQLADRFAGHDAVVFSAGAHGTGPERTTLIDGKGLEKSADAAARAGVPGFVLVSVFPDAGRDRPRNDRFEHYMRVKKAADSYLVGTDLDWLIVRPSTLLDEPGNGSVEAGLSLTYGSVHRDNVAAFIAAALQQPELNRVLIELNDGIEPAPAAVSRLAEATNRRRISLG